MISFKKVLWSLVVTLSWTSVSFSQSTYLEVDSTPYDHQMARIEPTLTAPSGYAIEAMALTLVNEWMIELRALPYRYSRQWLTPSEVAAARAADCKGKALTLYDRLQLNGASNVRLVIGKRHANDLLTHAWLEWDTQLGTLLLDPTFNWSAVMKAKEGHNYIAFYGYERARKYQTATTLMAGPIPGMSIPAHGAISRPIRSVSRARSNQWFFDEEAIYQRSFSSRPSL